MRPVRLTITAFGPYAGTEVVEFDALADLGLFVVAGNNGSGKSTIFDAMHYSLFGTLPGARSDYSRLRSDHAAPTVECTVAFDFVAHGVQWRVERSPKQTRPKRRGTGTTTVENRAVISRIDAGQPVTVANRINEVNDKCIELVGLTGRQFERVVLLPQGEFSRALSESGTQRRSLLRALFSAEVFGDAASLLAEQAAKASAADQTAIDRLERQIQSIATAFAELSGVPVGMSADELASAIATYRGGRLVELEQDTIDAKTALDDASLEHQRAVELAERLTRRARVDAALERHRAGEAQYEHDRFRLDAARAAVPVVGQTRAAAEQHDRHEQATVNRDRIWLDLLATLEQCGLNPPPHIDVTDIDEWSHRLRRRADDVERLYQLHLTISQVDQAERQLIGEQRRVIDRLGIFVRDIDRAKAELRQSTVEREQLSSLPSPAQARENAVRRRSEFEQLGELNGLRSAALERIDHDEMLGAQIEQAERRYEQALDAQSAQAQFADAARDALEQLAEAERRSQAGRTYRQRMQQLLHARTRHRQATAFADAQWDGYIAGTAARVAEALVHGESCPVCGSAEHPNPAVGGAGDNRAATNDDVVAARLQVQELAEECHTFETEVERLKARDPDIASCDDESLNQEIVAAKQLALAASNQAEQAAQTASMVEQGRRELGELRAELQRLTHRAQLEDKRTNQLIGALGEIADATIGLVAERAEQAEQVLGQAERAADRLVELNERLQQLSDMIERVGLDQLATKSQQVSIETQLAERARERTSAIDELNAVGDRVAMSPDAVQSLTATELESLRAAAANGHAMFVALQSARARLDEATTANRRARATLAKRVEQSPFETADQALGAFEEPHVIEQLELTTVEYVATGDRLAGQLEQLTGLPDSPPDVANHARRVAALTEQFERTNRVSITAGNDIARLDAELGDVRDRQVARAGQDTELRRLERVAALVKGDNDRNTSLENWVLSAHLRDVVELANIRLARSTQQRFQLCVLDDGENRRGRWGLDLGVEDTVTGTRRPTAGLSGGELFQASLALALGLADAVMTQSAGVYIDALFIDEGFGSLDEASVERAIDLLDELRGRGAMVGVITHVPALLDALPRGITVESSADGSGSTIRQRRTAA